MKKHILPLGLAACGIMGELPMVVGLPAAGRLRPNGAFRAVRACRLKRPKRLGRC